MSVKLYEKDVYLTECTSHVIGISQEKDHFLVLLDQTIFSPRAGGQPGDTGTIDGSPVISVFEKNEKIYHALSKATKNKEVLCKINWANRLDMMQNHCGEHILSGIFFSEYHATNKGFHMGNDTITMDINMQNITDEILRKVENIANDVVYANLPVETNILKSVHEAGRYPLRKPLNVTEDIKIVTINGVDCVACCGTHPFRTGEVGIIKILKAENYKGMTRIYFKCGKRALEDYQIKHDSQMQLYQLFSANELNLMEKIKKEEQKNQEIKKQLLEIKDSIYETEVNKITEGFDRFYLHKYSFYDMNDLKRIAKKVSTTEDKFLTLISIPEKGVLLFHNGGFNIHCGNLIKEYAPDLGGKGGGSDKMAQAAFPSVEAIDKFLEKIDNKIR